MIPRILNQGALFSLADQSCVNRFLASQRLESMKLSVLGSDGGAVKTLLDDEYILLVVVRSRKLCVRATMATHENDDVCTQFILIIDWFPFPK